MVQNTQTYLLVQGHFLHHGQVLLAQWSLPGSNGGGATQLQVINEPMTAISDNVMSTMKVTRTHRASKLIVITTNTHQVTPSQLQNTRNQQLENVQSLARLLPKSAPSIELPLQAPATTKPGLSGIRKTLSRVYAKRNQQAETRAAEDQAEATYSTFVKKWMMSMSVRSFLKAIAAAQKQKWSRTGPRLIAYATQKEMLRDIPLTSVVCVLSRLKL